MFVSFYFVFFMKFFLLSLIRHKDQFFRYKKEPPVPARLPSRFPPKIEKNFFTLII